MKPAVSLKLRSRINLEPDTEGECGMLFDTQTAVICACNSTGWVLVEAMKKGAHVARLTDLLTEQFDIDEDTARKDVLSLVKELRTLDMLEAK